MTAKQLTEHHLEFVSLKGGCTGSSESTHVKMPHCWKSHAMPQVGKDISAKDHERTRRANEVVIDYDIASHLDRCGYESKSNKQKLVSVLGIFNHGEITTVK